MSAVIPKAALDQHVAILAKTGKGKTYAAKGIVERLLEDGRQVCVLDPTAAWWGLRLGADGKSNGFDVVLLGGKHADIPLSERSGEAVARLVTEQHANVVIDTSGMTAGEYTRWFTDFASTLYRTIREPLHLIIDEAHNFMPQGKVPDPQVGKMLHAGNRLMSGGRSLGIRGMMITQRPAKLHKDSLTCADTLIAMGMIAPQDRGAVKEWIDGAGDPRLGKEVLDSLAQLQRGEGWVWYPEGGHLKRVQFPAITTYDSSATPKHGAKKTISVKEIDLGAVKAAMAEAVREAEANDPKLLRAEIAKLKAEATKKPKAEPDDKAIAKAVADRDRHWAGQFKIIENRAAGYVSRLGKIAALSQLNGEAELPKPVLPVVETAIANIAKTAAKHYGHKGPVEVHINRRTSDNPADSSLGKGERVILTAVAQHAGGVTREQLTVLTGYKRSSRDTYLQRLRQSGLIYDEEDITATKEGIDALGPDFEPLPTGDALREYWLDRLGGGEQAILALLCNVYPNSMERDRISREADYQRSSRDTFLQRLSSRKLITTNRDGVRAADMLFG